MPSAVITPEQKKVTISSKRQFTIPQKFFTKLGFGREAICTLGNGMLIIEPAKPEGSGAFAEQILSDLISEGYSGKELLSEFKSRQSKVRPAVEAMLQSAREAAHGIGDYASYDEVFGEETQ
ncbi:MAG TPA: AbrB family transcriptional regulator [Lachnospiraceae bacterium]|nr:AbrB family transcriptional regulator [Lachnospiraceae bacterium]